MVALLVVLAVDTSKVMMIMDMMVDIAAASVTVMEEVLVPV